MDLYQNIEMHLESLASLKYAFEVIDVHHVPNRTSQVKVHGQPNMPLDKDYYEEVYEQVTFLSLQFLDPLTKMNLPFNVRVYVDEAGEINQNHIECDVLIQLPHTEQHKNPQPAKTKALYDSLPSIINAHAIFEEVSLSVRNHELKKITFSGICSIKEGHKAFLQIGQSHNQKLYQDWTKFIQKVSLIADQIHTVDRKASLLPHGWIAKDSIKDAIKSNQRG